MDPGMTDLGRFAEPSLYILVSLSSGPKHGYAIMTDVAAISGSPMGPGTLYGALDRLVRRGLIEPLEPEDRRRPYRLTDARSRDPRGAAREPRRLRADRARSTRRAGLIGIERHGSTDDSLARHRAAALAPAAPSDVARGRRRTVARRDDGRRVRGALAERYARACPGPGRHAALSSSRRTRVIPIDQGFPVFVPDAHAFIVLVDPDRGTFLEGDDPTGERDHGQRPRAVPGLSASRLPTRTRASRTSGSTVRVTSRATTGSGRRPPASRMARRREAWIATRSRSMPMAC